METPPSDSNIGFRFEGLLFIPVLLGILIGIPGTIVTACFYGQRIKKSTTSTTWLLGALAVFDLITLILNVPCLAMFISNFYIGEWKDSKELTFMIYLSLIPKYWSNTTLLLAATERVFSIVFPIKKRIICTRRIGIVSIVSVIIIGPIVVSPTLLRPPLFVIPSNGTTTYLQMQPQTQIGPEVFNGLTKVVLISCLVIPVTGILICNICFMTVMLYRFRAKSAINTRNTMTRLQVKELHATKLVLIVTVIFIVSVVATPMLYAFTTRTGGIISLQTYIIIMPLVTTLETVNYSMNVFVYYAGSRNFRMETRKMLNKICSRGKTTKITRVVTFANM